MDNRKPPRSTDDVPIIGDYSEVQNARLRAETPQPPPPVSEPRGESRAPRGESRAPRGESRARDDRLVLDPSDMQRHARLKRQREHKRFGKLRIYAPIALGVAIAGVVYWNFDTLRGITVDFSELTSLFDRDAPATGGDAPRGGGGLETAPVESQVVAGTEAPTGLGDAPPPAVPREATRQAPASQEQSAEERPADPVVAAAASEDERLARLTPPAPPPEPETFAFGLPVNNVSEGDAAAAVLVLRDGDRRAASAVTWWTSSGTAMAGTDYVDLGKVVVKLAPGEQNRTIRIPIIGDQVAEGPESFYVHLATSERVGAPAEELQTEVVINDDD